VEGKCAPDTVKEANQEKEGDDPDGRVHTVGIPSVCALTHKENESRNGGEPRHSEDKEAQYCSEGCVKIRR